MKNLAIHINGIKCKNGETKNLGKNPLDYVGIYPIDKNTIKLLEKKDEWCFYTKIENTDTFTYTNHGLILKKIYPLSEFYNIYKWDKDKGFDNFSTWLR